ncbi:MAG: hypothetical protein OXH57_12675 [Ekhidna sp.]|nr:hypothetical protein [Ekhidna sp.]
MNTGITNAKVTGGVSATVGGLVGPQWHGTISACYVMNTTSSASGTGAVGSFIGFHKANNSIITACYTGGRPAGS